MDLSDPLVIAHHVMWTAYGWWLPNDPRGSTSQAVYTHRIADLGEHHLGRKRVQPASRDMRSFYQQAERVLQFPLLEFRDDPSITCVADAIERTIKDHAFTCYACVIMPDHVHLLIRKHKHRAEEMIEIFQQESRSRLSSEGLRTSDHPTWTKGGWKVFLDHPDDVRRTIRYVDDNVVKPGLPRQSWPFVTPYNDWPLHPGHSPNSPYAQALQRAGRYRWRGQ